MKQYRTEEIRNIGIIAHSGAGKTSLIEAMLYNGGAIERIGVVDDGNTVADYASDEIERKTSLNCSVCIAEWGEHKLNLIDTPGAEDFYGDLHGVLRVVDAVIVVVDATTGVEGGTEKVWEVADKYNLPRILFINKMDKENASFENALASISDILETRAVPVQIPIGKEDQFTGIVDVIQEAAFLEPSGNAPVAKSDVPDDLAGAAEESEKHLLKLPLKAMTNLLKSFLKVNSLRKKSRMGYKLES